jgi:hypothetical protein
MAAVHKLRYTWTSERCNGIGDHGGPAAGAGMGGTACCGAAAETAIMIRIAALMPTAPDQPRI